MRMPDSELKTVITQMAVSLGYSIIKASPFEWGLIKNGKGIRTWFSQDLGNAPQISDPKVIEAILIAEGIIW